MQTPSSGQKSRPNDLEWYLLAEYPLGEWTDAGSRQDIRLEGRLFLAIRDLGLPPECLQLLKRTLADFEQYHPGRSALPVDVRLFCQRKTVEGERAARTSRPEPAGQAIHLSGTELRGGWGYFLIDRGEDALAGSPPHSRPCVDLYLYREGE